MKSKIRPGIKALHELRPTTGVLHPDFKYERESNLREKFDLIRARQAKEAAQQHTVIQLKRKTK